MRNTSSKFIKLLFLIIGLVFYSSLMGQIPASEIDYVIRIGIENGLSDFQILDELRNRGLPEKEVQLINDKILLQRRAKISPKELNSDSIKKPKIDSISELKQNLDFNIGEIESFGRNLFNGNQFIFKSEVKVPSPKNYIIGSGDGLILDLSGIQDKVQFLTVNPEGFARVELLGPIYLSGLSLIEARDKIKVLLAKIYPQLNNGSTRITLMLREARSIQVLITGEVERPAEYTISSLSSLLNALYLCGGPNKLGSFRKIEIIRGNKVFQTVDLYPYLTSGIMPQNTNLEAGDIIRVPFAETRTIITGAVKKPARFELLPGENLSQLLLYCGGFQEDAFSSLIQVERYSIKEKLVIDVPDSLFKSFIPKNGDKFFVGTIGDRFSNKVKISGSVYRPGTYAWKPGMKVLQLINLGLGVLPEAYNERALLFRKEADGRNSIFSIDLNKLAENTDQDIDLKSDDELIIKNIFELEETNSVNIEGAVQKPGIFPYREGLRLKDLIFLAGGLLKEAFIEKIIIFRKNSDESKTSISLSLIDNNNEEWKLEAGDIITINSKKDFSNERIVTIYGEVNSPGIYQYAENLSLKDLIFLSKGFSPFATEKSIEITRRLQTVDPLDKNANLTESILIDLSNKRLNDTINEIMLQPFDVITIRNNPFIKGQSFVEIYGDILFPGKYALKSKDERISSLFTRAGGNLPDANLARAQLRRKIMFNTRDSKVEQTTGLKVDSFQREEVREFDVAINLLEAIKKPGSLMDIFLEPEDKLFIPRQNNLILVNGEVNHSVAIGYHRGKKANFYIDKAGGFKDEALKKKTFVIYPDGSANSTKNLLGIKFYPRVEPGTEVVVPQIPLDSGRKKPFSISDLTLVSSTIAGISTFIIGIVQLLK